MAAMISAADPRRRGAQPAVRLLSELRDARSPQARGSTGQPGPESGAGIPIPAGAGLNRPEAFVANSYWSDPRRRGAQPLSVMKTW